jgi:hypothetical protein
MKASQYRELEQVEGRVRVEYVAIGELERWPRNPKLHSAEDIQGSIARFGYVQPIVVDERTGRIVAGHGRLDALMALRAGGKQAPSRVAVDPESGEWLVPVLRGVGFADEREAEAYLLADNRTVELGGWDEAELGAMLDGLREAGTPVLGWDAAEIARLIDVDGYQRAAAGEGETEGGGEPQLDSRGLNYSVIVDFDDELAQGELLQELEGRGLRCRLLIS